MSMTPGNWLRDNSEMNPNDTPRTRDAIQRHWRGGSWSEGFENFARDLERESTILRGALGACVKALEAVAPDDDHWEGVAGHEVEITASVDDIREILAALKTARAALA